MQLRVKLETGAIAPSYAHDGDAGLDLRAMSRHLLMPGSIVLVGTGVHVEIPDGYVGKLYLRSGWATKHHVCLANGTGIIDSTYRGEVMVPLSSRDNKVEHVEAGERIAQLVISKVPKVKVEVADELSETPRGHRGFGSSGRF